MLTVHRKNAPALGSPDKNLITKELVVLFSFQEGALIARIVRQVIIDALDLLVCLLKAQFSLSFENFSSPATNFLPQLGAPYK
ncbi:uncharacterized protein METZ01_LOCUS307419 [marine metagenome]|uniref:Uncharacterized protein n=1 Tax=marine metagenome TaxID=408172 RepID=A0A382N2P0_9ZZZZ